MELEWGSIFGSHYKTSAGLDTFFFGFLSSFCFCFLSEGKKRLPLASLCGAANPTAGGGGEGWRRGASSISYLMMRCSGTALCSAFLLVLKCIGHHESGGGWEGGVWWWKRKGGEGSFRIRVTRWHCCVSAWNWFDRWYHPLRPTSLMRR